MEQPEIELNEHNKQEYPPMHTAEHLLNATMVKLFGCGRAVTAHIERRKSKCDYKFDHEPAPEEIEKVAEAVNKAIEADMPVTEEYITLQEAEGQFDLTRLPENVSQTLRIVCIGDYDRCPCAGAHVRHTGEIGRFHLLGYRYTPGTLRIRFKLTDSPR